MDKRKLIQIIEKELEELKILSEEIAESEDKTSLIIDLTLSKARLLCQEIELLRELTATGVELPTDESPEENAEEQIDEDEDEVSDVTISDPELEIVDFDEPESDEDDEINPEDSDEDEPGYDDNDDDLDEDDDDLDESQPEFIEEETEEEGLIEFGMNDNGEIEEEEEEEEPELKPTIESTELKAEPQAGVREITIDTDDDDLEPVKTAPTPEYIDRPVMREIPKPEEMVQGKPVAGESFQKERSLNDSIGETKSTESPLNSGAISSLRATIGLNDRFLFIREIFNNNTDKYNTVIDHLDKLETIQQAVDYLKANLTLQKNETSMKFVDLLKRRFSK